MEACSICGYQNAFLWPIGLGSTSPWPLMVISQILSSIIKTYIIFKTSAAQTALFYAPSSLFKICFLLTTNIFSSF
jgi:hypothetical protein